MSDNAPVKHDGHLTRRTSAPRSAAITALVGLMCAGPAALAQESTQATMDAEMAAAETKAKEAAALEKKQGWDRKLSVGTNFSATRSQSVVGTTDGTTRQRVIVADGVSNYRNGQHEWLNEGKISYTSTRTPSVAQFIKTADTLDLKSTYFYSLEKFDWLGPFARINVTSSLFPSYLVIPNNVAVLTADADGDGILDPAGLDVREIAEPEDAAVDYDGYLLTHALEPTLVKEVVGALANPIDKGTKLKVTGNLGAGAEQLRTQGGYAVVPNSAVADDPNTTESEASVQVAALSPYTSLGAQIELAASGTVKELISWNATATLFQPIITTADTGGRSGLDIMNIDTSAKVSVKLNKWASLDLVGSAKKYPLLQVPDEAGEIPWQVQLGGMLSATFNLI